MERATWEASQLEERIDRIVTLAATYPEAASRVARRFIAEEGRLACFSLVCEAIGTEYARVIFDSLPEYAWELLDSPLRIPIPLERALDAFSRELLSECMEEPDREPGDNPFTFLAGASKRRLEAILKPHAIERIALIASYISRAEMARIATALPGEDAKRLVMAVSRLHRVPRAVTKEQARRFADELATAFEAEAPLLELPDSIEASPVQAIPIHPTVSPIDWAISEIDLERELEMLARACGNSQEIDEIIKAMPSSESIRAIVESARQRITG